MLARQLTLITPGKILLDNFTTEYGLSQNRLALALHVPVSIINRIVNNKYRVNAELALKLAADFGTSAQFWMNLQTSHDLRMVERQSGANVKQEVRPVQLEPVAL